MERRLAAILAADVVGYTRLMGLDETGTLQRMNGLRERILEPLVGAHRGRVVKLIGDGLLIEFASVVDAVKCAVNWQQQVAANEADVDREKQLRFRIGINVGDIIVEDDDIHGDGVNIAARLEALADPVGICLSEDAWRQVRGKIDADFEDLGEQELKNVAHKVRVYRIATGSPDTHAAASADQPLPLPEKPSIAILPFTNLSGDPGQEYFSDGIAEDIITTLSRFPQELTVIDRHSSFAFKGRSVTAKQVGRELGVACMLQGSVRRGGGRARITAQLVDCARGTQLWAERYDRPLEDLFEVQDEITRHITTALSIELIYGSYSGNWMRGTESFEAWDATIQGIHAFMKFSREGIQTCQAAVERALAADPGYGAALAHMGWCFAIRARHFSSDPEPLWSQAREWCDKAMAIEASRPLGLALLGYCRANTGDIEQAVGSLKEAIALMPTAENHFLLGQAYILLGQTREGIAQTEQAMRLSPFCPGYFLFNMIDGYRVLGEITQALHWADKCIEKMPDSPLPVMRKAGLLWLAGRSEEAEAFANQFLAREPGFSVSTWAKGQTYRNPAHIESFIDALRQLGLPD